MILSHNHTYVRTPDQLADAPRIDLGDGFYLQNVNALGGYYTWEMYKGDEEDKVGSLITYFYPKFNPTKAKKFGHQIADIRINYGWRGRGLGEKMVRGFVQAMGSLTSALTGDTSDAAMRMWERLGAEKIPTNTNRHGFFYVLRR